MAVFAALCCVIWPLCCVVLCYGCAIVLCCVTVESGGTVLFCYDNHHNCTVLCQLYYGCAFTVLCYHVLWLCRTQVEITQWLCYAMVVL